ncbi:Fic family protein [Thioalkalivibrio sp. ALgr3]|uniref:Fic/DOC family protein n=1 Tax=Thioalkalivibrio sp. ALgr3 TaxID=1239292 RepID=UPI00035D343F|nr:Fic family protein [Thioalkalivibrio sp. ALgr3]
MPVEPETWPGTNVYINHLGLKDRRELAEAEASLTWVRIEEYRDRPHRPATFDLEHLCHIHHQIFQDLYDWAGHIRSFDIRKGYCEFTPAGSIERYAHQIHTELAEQDFLRGLDREPFTRNLARYYDLINRLHPFPEGNGRTQRLFIEDLAAFSGVSVNWDLVPQWQIVETAVQAFDGDREPTIWMFSEILEWAVD